MKTLLILLLALLFALVGLPAFAGPPSGVHIVNQVVPPPSIRVVPGPPGYWALPPPPAAPVWVAEAHNIRGSRYVAVAQSPALAVDMAMSFCTQSSLITCGCGVISVRPDYGLQSPRGYAPCAPIVPSGLAVVGYP